MGESDLIERLSHSSGCFELEKRKNTVLLRGGCVAVTVFISINDYVNYTGWIPVARNGCR
jgi:hypothetical protein